MGEARAVSINPLWIANNQCIFVNNFHQDFMASMHSNFFSKWTYRSLICWPNQGTLGELEDSSALAKMPNIQMDKQEFALHFSQHFIFSVTYEWAQHARVFVPGKSLQPGVL
jgi:hypothetical protein